MPINSSANLVIAKIGEDSIVDYGAHIKVSFVPDGASGDDVVQLVINSESYNHDGTKTKQQISVGLSQRDCFILEVYLRSLFELK